MVIPEQITMINNKDIINIYIKIIVSNDNNSNNNNKHYKEIRKKKECVGISNVICLHIYEKQDSTIIKVQYM